MRARARQAGALNRANLSLESANRELESFSYSVSHDLRSPLRAIDGYSLMLEEDYGTQLDETGRRYIQTIRSGTQRMAALIDDLLTFSQLSRQSLNRQTVDMTTLARRAAAEVLESQPEPKPAVNIPELPSIPGDPALLRQVWTNLIGNAVKYSSKTASPTVQVRAAAEGHQVRYEVQDNGVGFDMKYADKLFGVFQRLHSIDEYPGTGVGLAIVQRIIKRHEGAVTAKGEARQGGNIRLHTPDGGLNMGNEPYEPVENPAGRRQSARRGDHFAGVEARQSRQPRAVAQRRRGSAGVSVFRGPLRGPGHGPGRG